MIVNLTSTGTEEVKRKLQALGAQAGRHALAATAEDIEDLVNAWAGRHTKPGTTTGALFQSVFARPIADGDTWEVGHDLQRAPHAVFVHWGTKPHVIKPKNKRILRWGGPNGWVFSRWVHHPGYRGDPWIKDAAAAAPKLFEVHINAAHAALGA